MRAAFTCATVCVCALKARDTAAAQVPLRFFL